MVDTLDKNQDSVVAIFPEHPAATQIRLRASVLFVKPDKIPRWPRQPQTPALAGFPVDS